MSSCVTGSMKILLTSFPDYVCSERGRNLAGSLFSICLNNVSELIQLVYFSCSCKEETFIKTKLHGIQGVGLVKTGVC